MIGPLFRELLGEARAAAALARDEATLAARRVATVAILGLLGAAAALAALAFLTLAIHRALSAAAGPVAADLVLAFFFLALVFALLWAMNVAASPYRRRPARPIRFAAPHASAGRRRRPAGSPRDGAESDGREAAPDDGAEPEGAERRPPTGAIFGTVVSAFLLGLLAGRR